MNVQKELLTLLTEQEITPAELARRTGISPQYLSALLSGARGTTAETLQRIATATGTTLVVAILFNPKKNAV